MLALTNQFPRGAVIDSGLSVRVLFRGETVCMRAVAGRFWDMFTVLAMFEFAKSWPG